MNINGVNWLTMQEVAEILHCSITNVSALKNTNKILFKKVDGLFRCTEKDLKVYLNRMSGKGKESPFVDIMLDWDESCKFLYSYKPMSMYDAYFAPSLKYLVSDKGRIFNTDYTRELSQFKVDHGYLAVSIVGRNGENIQCLVHRLVAGIWCQNYHNKSDVHHIDCNINNNHYMNLLPVTAEEHKELHRLLDNKQRKEYRELVKKIRQDNAYPEKWKNGITIIDPDTEESDDSIYFLHITKRGYEKYKKNGTIDTDEILREVAYAKHIKEIRSQYEEVKSSQGQQECLCDAQNCDLSASGANE